MQSYVKYQQGKWERAQLESRSLTPMGAVGDLDIIKRWSLMKGEIRNAQGAYPCDPSYSCQGGKAVVRGKLLPRLTLNQANALVKEWLSLGKDLGDSLVQAGKPHKYILDDISKLETRWGYWGAGYQLQPDGYLTIASADQLFDMLDEYVIGLSAGVWAGYNIEEAWERMLWSLKSTIREWSNIRLFPDITPWVELFKWATIAGGLVMLWWILKPEPKKGGR